MGAEADSTQSAIIRPTPLTSLQPADTHSNSQITSTRKLWNSLRLGPRILADTVSALAAGFVIAPVIAIIDKGIIENASGKQPLAQSIRTSFGILFNDPRRFFTSRPYRLILLLYGGTFSSANLLDTYKSTVRNRPASATTSGPSKFLATSATNLSLSLYKDSQYTRIFGAVSSARPIPPVSYALFAARDCLTVFASFNLPSLISPHLPLSAAAEKYMSRVSAAQFLAPASIQLLSTPLHLLGLDMYNRDGGTRLSDRFRKVRLDWLKSSLARMGRIIPAFGIGGVVNTRVRQKLMTRLEA